MKTAGRQIVGIVVTMVAMVSARAQDPYSINQVTATVEKAIQLSWSSEANSTYRIEYADQLNDYNLGYTAWNTLYKNYPSHGTNTFVADAGNYDSDPPIPHPKYSPMRFYRIVNLGQESGTSPTVSIVSPSNGDTLSGEPTITVAAYSDAVLGSVKLYVDGEEQYDSDDGTNFVINTCEWANGPHVLFAVAKSQSGFSGLTGDNSVTYGSAVSTYVNVTFNNLITRWDFTELFFQPENGQTQTVTAAFAANCNWTIQVQDEGSNVIRTALGAGASMSWIFDGTDNNGTLLTPGLYWYVLYAQTNGIPLVVNDPPGGDTNSTPPMFSNMAVSEGGDFVPTTPAQAIAAGMDHYYASLPPYPPVEIDGRWYSWEEAYGSPSWQEIPITPGLENLASESRLGLIGTADASTDSYGGPSSQTSKGPQRNPKQHHIGVKGNFGVLYQDLGLYCLPPRLALPLPPYYVKIDGGPVGARLVQNVEPRFVDIAKNFVDGMKNSGYTNSWFKGSGEWTVNALKGNGALINSVNLGFLLAHGSYAETYENQADGLLHTYIWLSDGSYVHLNDMRLGAGGTLRWMTILGCDILRDQNIATYLNHSWMSTIISDNMHLLLGANSIMSGNENTTRNYAANLKKKQTIPSAWYSALRESLKGFTLSGPRVAKVMGHLPCFDDKLLDWQDPADSGIYSQTNQVWP